MRQEIETSTPRPRLTGTSAPLTQHRAMADNRPERARVGDLNAQSLGVARARRARTSDVWPEAMGAMLRLAAALAAIASGSGLYAPYCV